MPPKKIIAKQPERPSPSVSAQKCPDKIKKGNDGEDYISRADKNGVYHWKKIKAMGETKKPEEYYSQFSDMKPQLYDTRTAINKLSIIAKLLRKNNIYLMNVGWNGVWNFTDYADMEARERLQKKGIDENDTSIVYFTEFRRYWAGVDGKLYLLHDIKKEDKNHVIELFKKHFGNAFKWDGSNRRAFLIQLSKK